MTQTQNESIEDAVGLELLRIGAVHYSTDPPYQFTSGTLSPVYVDCRMPISHVQARDTILRGAIEKLGNSQFDIVAGGETAGIPYAALIANSLGLPMVYVRKKPKGFGRNAQIEGTVLHGARVLLVEDLTFDAKSKIHFASALRDAGGIVDTCFSIFDYGIAESQKRLRSSGLTGLTLVNWDTLLPLAQRKGYFTNEQCTVARQFLADPPNWSITHQQYAAKGKD
jgi:orotate phosphoribosyltransferase